MKSLIFKLSIIAITLFSVVACNNSDKTTTKAKATFDKISETKKIRVGYISYPPGFIVNPNTKEKSGIFNDVLVEIAKRNGFEIEYKEEVTWATMIEALKTDRVDLIANPVWATAKRKENADFSNPVYFSPIGIYVRSDDDRFLEDRTKINDPKVRIAAVDGEVNNFIATEDFSKANLTPFPNNIDVAQLFLEIQSNKKDVTFAEPMFAFDYMQKNPGKLKNIAENDPIRNYPNCYMYKKGESAIGDFINKNVEAMLKDGSLEQILAKYEPTKGTIIRVNDSRAKDKQ
jgi:ABC-type amino acid transport substrate-binding protein